MLDFVLNSVQKIFKNTIPKIINQFTNITHYIDHKITIAGRNFSKVFEDIYEDTKYLFLVFFYISPIE